MSTMDRPLERRARWTARVKRWRGGLLAAALVLGALIGLRALARPSLDASRVRTANVVRGSIEAGLSASGVVRAAQEHTVVSPIDGRILRVLRRAGDLLEPNEPILELDVSESRLAVERLEGEIEQAEGRLRSQQAALREELGNAESRRAIQQLEVQQLEYHLAQRRRLHGEGLVSEAALKEAETELEKARIELRAAHGALTGARQRGDAESAALGAKLRVLRSERRAAAERLDRSSTRADRSGVLTWVATEEGAAIRRGEVLARIADLAHLRVEGSLSDIHSSRLRIGQPVHVAPPQGEPLEGSVESVHPEVEGGVQRFTVSLERTPDPSLRPNLRVDVLVITERKADVRTLAKGPFANGPGRQSVFVVEEGWAERRSVVLGASGWERWEVVEGLEEGEVVIVSDMSEYVHLERIELQ